MCWRGFTWEYSYDVAMLAKQAGLYVHMDTNGFSSPEAIHRLAPFVDMVYLGIKGHADPDFYAKRMRSPGAVPHVLAAAKAWHESPTMLGISDVVPPPHWLSEEAAAEHARRFYTWIAEELGPLTPAEHARRFYTWIAEELGPLTPLELRGMVKPQTEYGEEFLPLLPHTPDPFAIVEFMDRLHLAEELAQECGLQYVYSDEYRSVSCHHCGGLLLGRLGSPDFDLHVTDGHCDHCGGAVPITALTRVEWEAIQREEA